jgi:L-lactate dehydrogenase
VAGYPCRDLLPPLLEVTPRAVVLIVTNPVDVVTYAALKILGLPPSQVLGAGMVLDSSRLRSLIARHCGVAVQSVHAYIAGEHGDSEIALWTSATVGAVPALQWDDPRRRRTSRIRRPDGPIWVGGSLLGRCVRRRARGRRVS